MKDTEIIEALRSKLTVPGGRHLYGVLGSYPALVAFSKKLRQAKSPDGRRFPKSMSVNLGILKAIPDDEFRQLVENEAKRKLSNRAVQKLVDEAKYREMQEGVEWEKAENLDKKTTEK